MIQFTVPLSVLAYTSITGDLVMESGPIELSAGSSSGDIARPRRLPSPARHA